MLVTAVAAFLRLWQLDLAAFRGDSLEFWRICGSQVTSGQLWSHWIQVMGNSGQFPFAMAFTKAFLEFFKLQPSIFAIRLPTALWGILTIPAAFGLGRACGGARCGILLALLMALSPFHLQMTREAYYYAPLILGCFLLLWAALDAVKLWRSKTAPAPGWGFPLLACTGFALMVYSQPVGWLVGLLLGALCVLALFLQARRRIAGAPRILGALIAGFCVIGIPLLFYDWALPQMLRITSGPIREHSMAAFVISKETLAGMLAKAATSFAWGATPIRAALTFLSLAAGLWVVVSARRTRAELLLLPVVIVGGIVGFLKARESAGALFEARYIVPVLPAYLLLVVLGLLALGDALARWTRKPALATTGGLLGCLAMLQPAWLCVGLTGHPAPYKDIVRWCDANLPPRAPVIVDRWFEPGNELVPYPSTNVLFTFTVPNEPVKVFEEVRWRDTARSFFERFPDAAYMELAKEYWEVPSVGPWHWPRQFFARHAAIRNEAGLKLRELGLAARGDFYWSTTNRLVVDIFYNTREDVIRQRAAAGMKAFAYYGPGWGYTKTQDYRDWRVLQQQAELQLINLTATTLPVRVVVRAVAAGAGGKDVMTSAGAQASFPAGELRNWEWGRMELAPGINTVSLRDPSGKVPLLVEGVGLQPDGG